MVFSYLHISALFFLQMYVHWKVSVKLCFGRSPQNNLSIEKLVSCCIQKDKSVTSLQNWRNQSMEMSSDLSGCLTGILQICGFGKTRLLCQLFVLGDLSCSFGLLKLIFEWHRSLYLFKTCRTQSQYVKHDLGLMKRTQQSKHGVTCQN